MKIIKILLFLIFLTIFPSIIYSGSYFLALKEGDIYSEKNVGSPIIGKYKEGDFFEYTLEEGGWIGLWNIPKSKFSLKDLTDKEKECVDELTKRFWGSIPLKALDECLNELTKKKLEIIYSKIGYTFSPDWISFEAAAESVGEAARTKLIEVKVKKEGERQEREEERRKEEERREKTASFPKDIQELINGKKIRIGMTGEQVIFSWGRPERINESIGAWGKHEQWIYSSTYLYFENGILTSYQRSKIPD